MSNVLDNMNYYELVREIARRNREGLDASHIHEYCEAKGFRKAELAKDIAFYQANPGHRYGCRNK